MRNKTKQAIIQESKVPFCYFPPPLSISSVCFCTESSPFHSQWSETPLQHKAVFQWLTEQSMRDWIIHKRHNDGHEDNPDWGLLRNLLLHTATKHQLSNTYPLSNFVATEGRTQLCVCGIIQVVELFCCCVWFLKCFIVELFWQCVHSSVFLWVSCLTLSTNIKFANGCV